MSNQLNSSLPTPDFEALLATILKEKEERDTSRDLVHKESPRDSFGAWFEADAGADDAY